ncbi:MAG: four helix bundle protein [Candidatus Berkelbacteria bacterium]|nr:four helix bundle protein [Candidatus Berkelbacteria bacterium]
MPEAPSHKRKYDLEERTAAFGENVIRLLKKIEDNSITKPIKTQLTKCATSVGANYCEADDAENPQDFKHKIGICKKESRESKHFLRMLAVATPKLKDEIPILWQEAKELNLIFNTIYRSVKK